MTRPVSRYGTLHDRARLHLPGQRLIVYVEDSRLRIDNNLTENAIRPFVIVDRTPAKLATRDVGFPDILTAGSATNANEWFFQFRLYRPEAEDWLKPWMLKDVENISK